MKSLEMLAVIYTPETYFMIENSYRSTESKDTGCCVHLCHELAMSILART